MVAKDFVIFGCDFYPRPPRGGRHLFLLCPMQIAVISIHALREEGDPAAITLAQFIIISIHALREEGDPSSL